MGLRLDTVVRIKALSDWWHGATMTHGRPEPCSRQQGSRPYHPSIGFPLSRTINQMYCMCIQLTSLVALVMKNDLIDDDGFGELGVPSSAAMWKQQAHLLTFEVDDLQRELRQARINMFKLITMHADATKERDRMKLELDRVRWQLSDLNLQASKAETAKLNAYAGAYKHGKTD